MEYSTKFLYNLSILLCVNFSSLTVPFNLVSYGTLDVEIANIRWETETLDFDPDAIDPSEYNIISYGAGSISDTIHPASP